MEVETINNWRVLIAGMQGTGKTTLAKYMASRTMGTVIIDPLNEYSGFHRFVPPSRNYDGIQEFLAGLDELSPSMVIVDESNRFFPSGKDLGAEISDEYDFSRHYGRSWVFVVRKPQSLSSYILDLVNVLCIYNLPGSGDKAFLKGFNTELWDMVSKLEDHQFVFYAVEDNLMKVCEVKTNGSESTDYGRREERSE